MEKTRPRLLILIGLSLAGCNERVEAPPRPPLLVRAEAVKWEPYSQGVAITGEIAARVESDLSFRVSGRVISRSADVGQHVEAGAVLARIDPAEQRADLDAANAAVASAEATLKIAQAAFDRQKTLSDTGFATRSTFDSAQQNLSTAKGSLDQAQAQVETARDVLSYSELRADRAGVITARNIEAGQVAQAAQTAFTLAEDGPRDAVFNVFESIFLQKPSSDKIRITMVSNPAVHAMGHVREIAPAVDPKTGTVRVKVEVENAPAEMALGSAVVGSGAFAPHDVAVLPWSAETSQDGKPAVWIVDPTNKSVSMRRVQIEAYEKGKLLISGGLSPGDLVVTEGDKFLFSGQQVAIEEPKR